MSGSRKVKITNKRTGKVTSGKTATSVMQPRENERSVTGGLNFTRIGPEKTSTEFSMPRREKVDSDIKKDISSRDKFSKGNLNKAYITSLVDFIFYAYSRKGKSLKALSSKELNAIAKNARLTEEDLGRLLQKSREDVLLAVPRQIMLTVHGFDGLVLVKQEARRFLASVLKQHPLYHDNDIVPVISNLEEAVEPVEALRAIATLNQESLERLIGLEKPKAKDLYALRSNAINCLALWLWDSRGVRVSRVVRWLYDGYWSQVAPADSDQIESLQVVTDTTSIPGLGSASAQFKAEADESARLVISMRVQSERLRREIDELRDTLGNLEDSVRERDNTIRALSEELQAERTAHTNSRVHLGDDHEHLRSSMVRRLRREVSLLTEGLQALRKEPPKIRVMDDHAERALEGLKAAMSELEEEK